MNIITGTTKTGRQISFGLLLLLLVAACTPTTQNQEAEAGMKSDVKVISPVIKTIEQTAAFKGTTRYLQTNAIRSQVGGIVKAVNCQVPGSVSSRQPLFVIQPVEAAALQKSDFRNQDFRSFQDTVFSYRNGIISDLKVQAGDFVQAGDVLATCIRTSSLRILIDVPAEQPGSIRTGMSCSILLPDGQIIAGRVTGQWPSATGQNQTQPFVVEPLKTINMAENISLAVRFKTGEIPDALLVPKSALLGNELQTSFWVMKMVNDTMCVKVPVTKGPEADSMVQLLQSGLTNSDRLVYEGGYGLPDTATVRIIKK